MLHFSGVKLITRFSNFGVDVTSFFFEKMLSWFECFSWFFPSGLIFRSGVCQFGVNMFTSFLNKAQNIHLDTQNTVLTNLLKIFCPKFKIFSLKLLKSSLVWVFFQNNLFPKLSLSIRRMQFSQPCSKVVAQSESFSTNSHENETLMLMRKLFSPKKFPWTRKTQFWQPC